MHKSVRECTRVQRNAWECTELKEGSEWKIESVLSGDALDFIMKFTEVYSVFRFEGAMDSVLIQTSDVYNIQFRFKHRLTFPIQLSAI